MVGSNVDKFEAIQSAEPQRRTTATDRDTKPFQKPVTATWDQSMPYSELANLILGVLPKDMDDRWFIYTDEPDAYGNGAVHMYRSWTNYKNYEIKFLVQMNDDGQVKETEDVRFTGITWETDESRLNGVTEDDAKEMVKGVWWSLMRVALR